jgi:hypothetical protein
MNLLQLAGALPRDPQFREWVGEHWSLSSVNEYDAADVIRQMCEIESRRELATDTEAQARFHQFLRKPFVAWKEQQHVAV